MRDIDERDIQAIRLMLMMYRQGWIDASAHLAAEAMRQERAMKKEYERLCP